jgi:rare lipoprotein A
MLPPFRRDWLSAFAWRGTEGDIMLAIDRTGAASFGIGASVLAAGVTVAWADLPRHLVRCMVLMLAAASLAACAQSSVVSRRAALSAPVRQAALEPRRSVLYAPREHAAVTTRPPFVADRKEARPASNGVASFYSEGQQTANGEQFDPNELTAAHPSLPFGTRLRVTNMSTGRSVTVRVNDRGPYVHGRVVDVSYSAARALGMVHTGVANVKLDVVR